MISNHSPGRRGSILTEQAMSDTQRKGTAKFSENRIGFTEQTLSDSLRTDIVHFLQNTVQTIPTVQRRSSSHKIVDFLTQTWCASYCLSFLFRTSHRTVYFDLGWSDFSNLRSHLKWWQTKRYIAKRFVDTDLHPIWGHAIWGYKEEQ